MMSSWTIRFDSFSDDDCSVDDDCSYGCTDDNLNNGKDSDTDSNECNNGNNSSNNSSDNNSTNRGGHDSGSYDNSKTEDCNNNDAIDCSNQYHCSNNRKNANDGGIKESSSKVNRSTREKGVCTAQCVVVFLVSITVLISNSIQANSMILHWRNDKTLLHR